MLKPTCNIVITPKPGSDRKAFRFNYTNELSIISSWDNLTDTAELAMPRRLKFDNKVISSGEEGLFQRGDKIKIDLGDDNENETIFEGFITQIHPGVPVRFKCEDIVWKFKKEKIKKAYRSATLRQILTDYCPIPFKSVETDDMGAVRFNNESLAQKLNEFKKNSLPSFVRNGTLYVGLVFWPELQRTHQFGFLKKGGNIISSELEYLRKEDIVLEVEAISILPDNKRLIEKVGDEGGDKRTLHFYNVTSKKALKERAEEELKKLNYEGYRGSFTCFGIPVVKHGDKVRIKDELFGHAPGTYLVKKVETSFGQGGYRQKITIDRKL